MKRQLIVAAMVGVLALAGCSSQPDSDPTTDQDDVQQVETTSGVSDDAEPEARTAAVGEEIVYESNNGGNFVVTANGLESSAEATRASNMGGDGNGYLDCYLLLTIENESVDTEDEPYNRLARMWLEDADGVTIEPSSSGFSYGEYAAAPSATFSIMPGQTVRAAVPYLLPEGGTDYTLIVDGVRVPLTLVEGTRPIG